MVRCRLTLWQRFESESTLFRAKRRHPGDDSPRFFRVLSFAIIGPGGLERCKGLERSSILLERAFASGSPLPRGFATVHGLQGRGGSSLCSGWQR
jgi:hypothetical protein